MKKLFLFFLAAISLASCSDEEVLNDGSDLENGGYARFKDNVVQTIDFQGGNGSLQYSVVDPNGNGVKYRIYKVGAIVQGTDLGTVDADFVYNGFPADVSVSLQQLAQLYGLNSSDITYGDSFRIFSEVTTSDGKVFRGESPATTNMGATQNNTTADLLNSTFGYKQAMQFNVTVACQSYDASAVLGTYVVQFDEFEEYPYRTPAGYTVQCVAGDQPNTLKFINFSNEGTDLIVNVNPAAQTVTSNRVKIYSGFYTYGDCFAEGIGGLVFSCTGTINLKMRYSVGAGTFPGAWDFTLVKQ
jgi:hypothetical protein